MKIIALIITGLFSVGSAAETVMFPAPSGHYPIESITKGNAIDHGLGFTLLPSEGSECLLKINVRDTHNSKRIRVNIIHRKPDGSANVNTLGIEQAADTGNIFGSIILNRHYVAGSTAEVIMYKPGNIKVFHGKAPLREFGACQF